MHRLFSNLFSIFILTLMTSLLAITPVFAQVNKELPMIELRIGTHKLKAELANDNNTRSVGLMNRFSLKPDHGMVFVFEKSEAIAMWMKNTYIPLSVAFIDSKGIILNIEDMQPQTLDSHPAAGPALYALEMKKGWFATRGITAGAKIDGLEKAGKSK